MSLVILDAFALVKPDLGLVFWTVLIFIILWTILGKFAFKPIVAALKDRETAIENSLTQAEKARAEMATLVAKNEELLNQAKEERNQILHDAREAAERLKSDIIEKAKSEADKKIGEAIREIETQKKAAIVEVKNTVGQMALGIAEKVIRKELGTDADQKAFVDKLVKETNLN
jgi:F-type H+-transporting ATPase subunit b